VQEIIELRRDLHKYPEYGWCEYRTTAKLAGLLSRTGYEIFFLSDLPDINWEIINQTVTGGEEEKRRAVEEGADPEITEKLKIPGFIARLRTGRKGISRGLRCDMDAVGVEESSSTDHLPCALGFSSVHKEVCHACGHDGHMALAAATAVKIAEIKEQLNGDYTFIFQPAEEGCRGARALTNVSLIKELDELYGFHLGICAGDGEIVANPVAFQSSIKFDVEITGKSAHAGIEPEKGINALRCACETACALFNRQNQSETLKFNIGKFRSENARNVICDRVSFECECRDTDSEKNEEFFALAETIIKDLCLKSGCRYRIKISGKAVEISNSPELVEKIKTAAKKTEMTVIESRNFNACEDCGHLIGAVQANGGLGAYVVIGNSITAGHHKPEFNLSEDGLAGAADFLFNLMKS
jgi:aminobenzoyl-glutamate utilization protein A